MENNRKRASVVAGIACVLVAAALAHANLRGRPNDNAGMDMLPRGDAWYYHQGFLHGWPVVLAEHTERIVNHDTGRTDLLDWTSSRMKDWRNCISDAILSVMFCWGTGVVVYRLARRPWTRLQFSVGDLLCLTAVTAAVLGLVRFELTWAEPLRSRDPYLVSPYSPIGEFPWYDRGAMYLSLACLVGLVVSTVVRRLGIHKMRS
jgi:hypothetical protein